jgi:putative copper export protein
MTIKKIVYPNVILIIGIASIVYGIVKSNNFFNENNPISITYQPYLVRYGIYAVIGSFLLYLYYFSRKSSLSKDKVTKAKSVRSLKITLLIGAVVLFIVIVLISIWLWQLAHHPIPF